jgi:diguanylate cyclase (GGDEF)-like protein
MRIRTKVTEKLTPLQFVEPSGSSSACLLAISGPLLGVRFELGDAPITIGRSSEADITVPAAGVSRQHCRVFRDANGFHAEDLQSTNKTFVNGTPIQRIALQDGDRIKIGDTVLKFFEIGSIDANYHQQLLDMAVIDELTHLANRRHFISQLQQHMERAIRLSAPLCLIIVDLDHFKPVNDRFGHLAGDEVLRKVSQALRNTLPTLAAVGRLGGEEFGISLPDMTLDEGRKLAEAWRVSVASIEHRFSSAEITAQTIRVSASFGVASFDSSMGNPSEFLRMADNKLYEAKRAGRNCVVV